MALTKKPIVQGTFGTTPKKEDIESEERKNLSAPGGESPTEPESRHQANVATVTEIKTPQPESAAPTAEPSLDAESPFGTDSTEKQVAATTTTKASSRAARKPPTSRKVVSSRAEELQRRSDFQLRTSVEEAYKSAKRRPKEWGTAPIRISADAKARLASRREQDEDVLGVKFAETHYMEAAIASVPNDPEVAVQWVEEYLDTLGLRAPDTVGTTGRLRIETSAAFDKITRRMRTMHGYGKIGHLQNAAVLRLLDALDRVDEWNAPVIVDLDEQN